MKMTHYIILACFLVAVTSMFAGYSLLNGKNSAKSTGYKSSKSTPMIGKTDSFEDISDENFKSSFTEHKITPVTKITCEYYYEGDGKTETASENSPYFLIGLTRSQVENRYPDWEILNFDANEVVMRKNLEEKSNQYYILSEQNGYIAVFYKFPVNGTNLKEITSTHINALPPEEKARIATGIEVEGENALMKILEDYGS